MKVYDIRRKNLAALVKDVFGKNQAKLAVAIGVKQPQVNRWLSTSSASPRRISETSARHIEARLGLPHNGLDDPNSYMGSAKPSPSKALEDFQTALELSDHSERSILLSTISTIINTHKKDERTPGLPLISDQGSGDDS